MAEGNGEPSEFRQRLELWSAAMLAAATVATAYSAYESSRWGGEQSTKFTEAGAARTESAKARSDASSLTTIDATLFTEYAVAFTEQNEDLQRILENRFFRDEFKPAFDKWIKQVERDPDAAPKNPFVLDEYRPQRLTDSEELEDEASANFEAGREANQTSDNYTLATIFFAAVLFFAGIAGKFRSDRIVLALLSFGTLVFIGGIIRLMTLPFL